MLYKIFKKKKKKRLIIIILEIFRTEVNVLWIFMLNSTFSLLLQRINGILSIYVYSEYNLHSISG